MDEPAERALGLRDSTTAAVIVAEALHESAPADVRALMTAIAREVTAGWSTDATSAVLSRAQPRFAF
jgi:hypothetical protein